MLFLFIYKDINIILKKKIELFGSENYKIVFCIVKTI